MKILMTTDTIGGLWTYAIDLCQALKPYGVQIGLATMGKHLNAEQRRTLSTMDHVNYFQTDYKLEWMDDPEEDLAEASLWLQQVAYEYEPDLIHFNEYTFAGIHWYVPTLLVGHTSVCSWYWHVREQVIGNCWDRYCQRVRRGLATADRVVAPSRTMLHWLLSHYGPMQHSQPIYNASSIRPSFGQPKEEIVMTSGRSWDEAKNLHLLSQVAPEIAWPIYVAGDMQHPEGGRIPIDGLKPLGKLSRERMASNLSRASIYAHPARYEPFGISVLEAALSGCALLLSSIDSFQEIWGDAPMYASPDEPEEWKRKLNQLISDARLRHEIADRCHQHAQRYRLDAMAAQYMELYRQLLSQRATNQLHKEQR